MSSEIEKLMAATARDFLRDAVLRLEAAGYPHVLRVHDELVAEVPEGFGSVEEFERIMGEPLRSPTAASILEAGLKHMRDRAATYDAPQGERSMAPTVAAFNALTGHELTEEQGWLFMVCLKAARSQQGEFRADNFEDGAAYFGLYGEAAAKRADDEKDKPV